MSRFLWLVTSVLALVYWLAAIYHTGLVIPSGTLPPAAVAEALLGLVLMVAALGIIRRTHVAYVGVLAGTLSGLAIVLAHGLPGIDLAIHVVMLTGLAVGFAVLLAERRAPTSLRVGNFFPFPHVIEDVRRLSLVLVLLMAACGDLQSGQAGGPASASSAPPRTAATADCVELAQTTPVTVPPLLVTDLGGGLKRVTSAEGGYTLVVPSAWLATASSAGGIEPQFAQAHLASYDPKTVPTPRPEAGGMLPPEAGIRLDLELWWNPDHLSPERYAAGVRIGPDQAALLPGATVTVAGKPAYRFTIQDERRFQPTNAPLVTIRQTRAVWLVPTLREDRMLVVAATPAESDLLPAIDRAVATIAIAPGIRSERPVTRQRSDILKQWLLAKDGNAIPGRRVEAKLMTYADASAALSAPHIGDPNGPPTGGGPGSRAIPRMDHDPDALYWVVVVSGPDLPQGRGGPMGAPSPAPTAWIFYDTAATDESSSGGTGTQYAGVGPATPAWPAGFDALADLCR